MTGTWNDVRDIFDQLEQVYSFKDVVSLIILPHKVEIEVIEDG